MPKPIPYADRAAVNRATRIVADVYKVFRPLIFHPFRGGPDVAIARQISQYLAHTSGQVSITHLSRLYRRHMSSVTHAISKIEDLRDDPDFDALITTLEHEFNG
jgi:chromosomal replication initiation ATPase DnaA